MGSYIETAARIVHTVSSLSVHAGSDELLLLAAQQTRRASQPGCRNPLLARVYTCVRVCVECVLRLN